MATPVVPYWVASPDAAPVTACELLSDVEQIVLDLASVGAPDPTLTAVTHPFVMVMSQACDIEWHHKARMDLRAFGDPPQRGQERIDWDRNAKAARSKLMDGITLCIADLVDSVHALSGLPTKQWQMAASNQNVRYHVLREGGPESDHEHVGFPGLVLDFKKYFTLPCDEVHARVGLPGRTSGRVMRRSYLASPFLEDVASRFYNYQSRVALPDRGRAGQDPEPDAD